MSDTSNRRDIAAEEFKAAFAEVRLIVEEQVAKIQLTAVRHVREAYAAGYRAALAEVSRLSAGEKRETVAP